MRVRPFILALLAIAALAPPGTAQEEPPPPPIDCGPGDGRERLTASGFELVFDGPAVGYTNSVPGNEPTGTLQAERSGTFLLSADLVPHVGASVQLTMTWADANHDFDLFLVDSEGAIFGSSEGVTNSETIVADIAHCQEFGVVVRNYRGGPNQPLTLKAAVTPAAGLLACAEADPAPHCAGKEAGEAPDFIADTRPRLYLGGARPGQLAHTLRYAAAQAAQPNPMPSTMQAVRPTSGVPNIFTRTLTGNPDFGETSNFFPYFVAPLAGPVEVRGPIRVVAWLSSQTMGAADKLYFDFHADGARMKRVEIPGSLLGPAPRPVAVVIDGFEAMEASDHLTFGITSPRGNDNPPAQIGQAEWTLHYDAVQFQSLVTLPFALPTASA